jgi:hypothetical protein
MSGAVTAAFGRLFNDEGIGHSLYEKFSIPREKNYKLYLVVEDGTVFDNWPGHTLIGGTGPDGVTEAHGWYPDETNGWTTLGDSIFFGNGQVSGEVRNNKDALVAALRGQKGYALITYQVDEATYESAMSYIRGYGTQNNYQIVENSCVHAAFRTLEHVGLPVGFLASLPGTSPHALYSAIQRMPESEKLR